MRTAIYALSADPPTKGHIDVAKRGLNVCDRLVVAVGNNSRKKYTFSLQERVALTKEALKGMAVEVVPFEGLLVDFAYSLGINTVIRGVRNSADFEFERVLHDVNYAQRLGLDTVLIIADQRLSHVSSSAVKELQNHSAKDILDYVSMPVKQALEERMLGQVRVGLTGVIGAGKNYIASELKLHESSLPGGKLIEADLDAVARMILSGSSGEPYAGIRRHLSSKYHIGMLRDGSIDLNVLKEALYEDEVIRSEYNALMRDPILFALRTHFFSQGPGTILVESALLADCDALDLVNNNVMVVVADDQTRRQRLRESRNYSTWELEAREKAQLTYDQKMARITQAISTCGSGSVHTVRNYPPHTGVVEEAVAWIQNLPLFLA